MAKIRVELRVRGRVQGVFYRASAREQARALGLTGYARNLDDGSVEVVAEGEQAAIERLIAWCRIGPSGARVSDVEVGRAPATGQLRGFVVD
jgi:acylphosphatase